MANEKNSMKQHMGIRAANTLSNTVKAPASSAVTDALCLISMG